MTKGKGKTPGFGGLDKHIKNIEHKERAQPRARVEKVGQLEKHKDYVKRAARRKDKVKRQQEVKRKIALRNPDEFNVKMTGLELDPATGKMKKREKKSKADRLVEQMKTNKTSIVYLRHKEETDKRRLDELMQDVGGLSAGARNQHTLFVDSSDDDHNDGQSDGTTPAASSATAAAVAQARIDRFDPVKRLNTTKEMIKTPALRGNLAVMATQPKHREETTYSDAQVLQRVARGDFDSEAEEETLSVDDDDNAKTSAAINPLSRVSREELQQASIRKLRRIIERETTGATGTAARLMDGAMTAAKEQLLRKARAKIVEERQRAFHDEQRSAAKKYREVAERSRRAKSLQQLIGRVEKQNRSTLNVLNEKRNAKFKKGVSVRSR